jgi:hypothetical protein
MPNPTRPQPGQKPIASDWGRDVAAHVVRHYFTPAARDADFPGGGEYTGQTVSVNGLLQVWNGSRWESRPRLIGQFFGVDGSTFSSPAGQWYELAVTNLAVTKAGSRNDTVLLVEAALNGVGTSVSAPGQALVQLGVGITGPAEAARALVSNAYQTTIAGSREVDADAGTHTVRLFWCGSLNAPIEMRGSQHTRNFRVWEVDAAVPRVGYSPNFAARLPADAIPVPVCVPQVLYPGDVPTEVPAPNEDGSA